MIFVWALCGLSLPVVLWRNATLPLRNPATCQRYGLVGVCMCVCVCEWVCVCGYGLVGLCVLVCVWVCVCGYVCNQPIFSSQNDHFQLVVPLN